MIFGTCVTYLDFDQKSHLGLIVDHDGGMGYNIFFFSDGTEITTPASSLFFTE